jgi:hypothetical protein
MRVETNDMGGVVDAGRKKLMRVEKVDAGGKS